MVTMHELFSNRRRNLLFLAIVAAIFCALAVAALYRQQMLAAPHYESQTFFPDLAHHVREVTRIHVVSQSHGAFDVAFKPETGWVLPGRGNYPAAFDQVRKAIVAIAALQTVEPKTARVDWLHYLDLDPPSTGGKGLLITLSNEKGKDLASLIIGKSENIGDANGLTGYYVRKPDTMQSWLVKGALDIKGDPAAWMDKDVVTIDRARIQSVEVVPATGPRYSVARKKPSDADFTLRDLPPGRELQSAQSPNGVATAITGFSFDDIKPAKDLDFSNAAQLITHTFDGLTVTVRVLEKDQSYWATVSAEAAPGKPAAAKEARDINAHASGWAYKLPAYKAAQFTTSLESLLKPLSKKK